jgi:hypothetical protein
VLASQPWFLLGRRTRLPFAGAVVSLPRRLSLCSPASLETYQREHHFLEKRFLPEWEQRFALAARNPRDAHRRLGREQHLEETLSVRVARKVAQDHTVSWDRNRWGMLREEVCAGLRGAAVEIERRLNGSPWLRYRGRYVHLRRCPEPGETQKTKSNPNTMSPRITLGETMEADISVWRKTGPDISTLH